MVFVWYSIVAVDNELATIGERLKAIEKALSDYVGAIRSAQERQEGQEIGPRRVRAEITFDEASKRDNKTEADRQNTTQQAIRRAALYAFGAAVLYAGLAAIQLNEIHTQTAQVFHQAEVENANASAEFGQNFRQLKTAQQQVTAAQDSVKAVTNEMREDERAWIFPKVVDYQVIPCKPPIAVPPKSAVIVHCEPIMVTIDFPNTGKTPAKKFKVVARMEILNAADSPTFDYSNDLLVDGEDANLVTPSPANPKGMYLYLAERSVIPGTKTVKPIFLTPDLQSKWFSVEGRLTYKDVFNTWHWLTFCFANYSVTPTDIPDGVEKCAQYNDMDDNEGQAGKERPSPWPPARQR